MFKITKQLFGIIFVIAISVNSFAAYIPKEAEDYNVEVSKGNVTGAATFEKYGKNSDIDTASGEDIWHAGAVFTGHPTGSAEILEISSDDANDTSAGTGARTVRVYNLLDGTGAAVADQDVTLNGTSWVDVHASNTYYRGGSRIRVLTAGSGGVNAGEITLRHKTTTANIFAVMPAGNNQTAVAAFTVPLGKNLEIDCLSARMGRASGAAGSAVMRFFARPNGGVYNAVINPTITDASPYSNNSTIWVFEERTDLKWNCESVSDNNTIISAEFSGRLVDN